MSPTTPADDVRAKIARLTAAGFSATAANALVIGKAGEPVAILAWQDGDNAAALLFPDDAVPKFAFPDAETAVDSVLNVGVLTAYLDDASVN